MAQNQHLGGVVLPTSRARCCGLPNRKVTYCLAREQAYRTDKSRTVCMRPICPVLCGVNPKTPVLFAPSSSTCSSENVISTQTAREFFSNRQTARGKPGSNRQVTYCLHKTDLSCTVRREHENSGTLCPAQFNGLVRKCHFNVDST